MQSVDVIVPVYNGERYLAATLQSIIAQTHPPKSLIVVDDGSTDATPQIVDRFSRTPIPLRVVRRPNGGLSSARNAGIRESTAKYLAFCDADDVWAPQKLERQIAVFAGSGDPKLAVVYCNIGYIDANSANVETPKGYEARLRGNILADLLENNFVTGSASAVLIKRTCFEVCGVFDETLTAAEDWDMWLRLAARYSFDFAPDRLVFLRLHDQSMSQDGNRMVAGYFEVQKKWFSGIGVEAELRDKYQSLIVSHARLGDPNHRTLMKAVRNTVNCVPADFRRYVFRNRLEIFACLARGAVRRRVENAAKRLRAFKAAISRRLLKHE
jgi:glycosyltransferase involved in cell wall biosynthesis